MKKIFAILLLVLFAAPVWAQEKIKIGVVDLQRVISESQAGNAAKEKFRSQVKKVEADLLKEKQDVDRLKSDFDKKSSLMKEEDRKNLEKEIQKRERSYMLSGRDSQEELGQREREMTGELVRGIAKIVGDIGKSEKYTLILERSQMPVLYSDDVNDITKRVIELYNSRVPAPAKATKGK